MLDYTQEAWWSPILTPSSSRIHLSISVVASHLFVCEGIHLDESGLVLVLLIEQFLPLAYISVLRLAELIVYDRIETMLTLDQQTLNKQLLPKYLLLIL
ncbi:unnamed protein product [Rotaria sp. Silwood1]|nr:unnamed protein product [Rotaria sp. Silwood1]CAF0867641.1 unnamed protein product [Rotaria sp. Silwood1]CAF0883308.1 unnamed protein product [Rotaria sp. Silwood1]CAF3366381.1 unnamed protein product [Rotaria sp. Silwood1]CAF4947601.1 unnamed protein product [Rotaria sp. Silwood1]